MDNYNYHDAGTSLNAYKYPRPYAAPCKEELLARNSFPSVNGNKHLDKLLGETNQAAVKAHAAKLEAELQAVRELLKRLTPNMKNCA